MGPFGGQFAFSWGRHSRQNVREWGEVLKRLGYIKWMSAFAAGPPGGGPAERTGRRVAPNQLARPGAS